MIGHALEQSRHVVFGSKLARDLENARQPVLGDSVAREHRRRAAVGARRIRGRAERRQHRRRHDGRRVRLAQRAPARVVPEHLAKVPRQLRGGLLEHRERRLGVAHRSGHAPLHRGQARACVERLPRPLATPSFAREVDRGIERAPGRVLVPREVCDRSADQLCKRSMLPEPRVAQGRAHAPQILRQGVRARAGFPRPREQALEARFCGVVCAPLPLPREGGLLVQCCAARRVARPGRVFRLQAEELRAGGVR